MALERIHADGSGNLEVEILAVLRQNGCRASHVNYDLDLNDTTFDNNVSLLPYRHRPGSKP